MSDERAEIEDYNQAFDREKFGAGTNLWRRASSEIIADCRVFQVRRDLSADPRTGREHDFYVLEAPDWINVVPLTADNEVVMIEQYRHGTEEVTLEIPGGMVDAGEEPQAAARARTARRNRLRRRRNHSPRTHAPEPGDPKQLDSYVPRA